MLTTHDDPRPEPDTDTEPETSTTMTTTTPLSPAEAAGTTTTITTGAEARTARVTFGRIVAAEWYKLRTVRSNIVALLGAAAAAIGFGVLFSSLAGSGDGPPVGNNALSLSLGGFNLSQLIVAILGVAVVAAEYQTGLIRTWFAAAPSRLGVLAAKVGVYSGTVFVLTAVAAIAAFLAGQAVFPDSAAALTLVDDGVLQALAGTAFYAASIGAMGVGLGFLLRSTAAGASVVVSTLMIAPLLVGLLPSSFSDPIGKILPSNAASAVTGMSGGGTELLSAGWGVVVLLGWVAATVGAAAISLRRRDA